MWFAANSTAKTIKGIFAKTIPLNKNMQEGIIERDNAFGNPFVFPQTIQKVM